VDFRFHGNDDQSFARKFPSFITKPLPFTHAVLWIVTDFIPDEVVRTRSPAEQAVDGKSGSKDL
jgi:hypothetical protein